MSYFSDERKELAIAIPFDFGTGELMLHVKQPSAVRTKACLPVFQFLARNLELYDNPQVVMTDWGAIMELIAKQYAKLYPNLLQDFDSWVGECLQCTTAIDAVTGENTANLFNTYGKLDPWIQDGFKAYLAFLYALLHYAWTTIKSSELREYYTASTASEWLESFSHSIGETDGKLSKGGKRKG